MRHKFNRFYYNMSDKACAGKLHAYINKKVERRFPRDLIGCHGEMSWPVEDLIQCVILFTGSREIQKKYNIKKIPLTRETDAELEQVIYSVTPFTDEKTGVSIPKAEYNVLSLTFPPKYSIWDSTYYIPFTVVEFTKKVVNAYFERGL